MCELLAFKESKTKQVVREQLESIDCSTKFTKTVKKVKNQFRKMTHLLPKSMLYDPFLARKLNINLALSLTSLCYADHSIHTDIFVKTTSLESGEFETVISCQNSKSEV